MSKEKILIIEDDADILDLVKYHFVKEGYQVFTAVSGDEGIAAAKAKRPDLVLLDLMLPGIDGLEVCRVLKADSKTNRAAIIMLTAKGEESDIVAGLELGAQDYVTKPFSPRVLVARVRSVLRRNKTAQEPDEETIKIQDLVIDPSRHEVLLKGKPVILTLTEFRLLEFLAAKPGRVFTRYQIVDGVKGADYAVTERSVDVQIVGLRRKLGTAGKRIETIRGVGYKFQEE